MGEFGYILGQVVGNLPMFLLLLVGMVLVGTARSRLPGRSWTLAMAGIGMLLIGVLVSLVWAVLFNRLLPELIRDGWTSENVGMVFAGAALLQNIWHATGLGLVIAAVLAGRRATTDPPPAVHVAPQPTGHAPADHVPSPAAPTTNPADHVPNPAAPTG